MVILNSAISNPDAMPADVIKLIDFQGISK